MKCLHSYNVNLLLKTDLTKLFIKPEYVLFHSRTQKKLTDQKPTYTKIAAVSDSSPRHHYTCIPRWMFLEEIAMVDEFAFLVNFSIKFVYKIWFNQFALPNLTDCYIQARSGKTNADLY